MAKRMNFAPIIAILALVVVTREPANAQPAAFPKDGRALSLRVLQDRLQACTHSGICASETVLMGYMTRVDGFVIDRTGNDVIIIGRAESDRPTLLSEDLIVALQSVFDRFATREGNTIYVTAPGVSLDPQPDTLRKLGRISTRIDAEQEADGLSDAIKTWRDACADPQTARVFGLPSSGIARAMLDVDYDLKWFGSGAKRPVIPDFRSLADLRYETVRAALEDDIKAPLRMASMSRFWIYPTPLTFMADDSAALLGQEFGLQLLTEEQMIDAEGNRTGTQAAEPLAAQWAGLMTGWIPSLARADRDWNRVSAFARMLAVFGVLRDRAALETAGLSLDWLVKDYLPLLGNVPPTYAGHAHVVRYERSVELKDGIWTREVTMPSCGGVDMSVPILPDARRPDPDLIVAQAARRSMDARPPEARLYWDF